MIGRLFNRTFTVKRQVASVVDDVDVLSEEVQGTFKGHLQQASPEFAQSLGFTMTKTFSVWCPLETDVQDGDVLEVDEKVYAVKGVQENDNCHQSHKELVVELYGVIESEDSSS